MYRGARFTLLLPGYDRKLKDRTNSRGAGCTSKPRSRIVARILSAETLYANFPHGYLTRNLQAVVRVLLRTFRVSVAVLTRWIRCQKHYFVLTEKLFIHTVLDNNYKCCKKTALFTREIACGFIVLELENYVNNYERCLFGTEHASVG